MKKNPFNHWGVFLSYYENKYWGKINSSLYTTKFHIYYYTMNNYIINSHNYHSFAKSTNLGIYAQLFITTLLNKMSPTTHLS